MLDVIHQADIEAKEEYPFHSGVVFLQYHRLVDQDQCLSATGRAANDAMPWAEAAGDRLLMMIEQLQLLL
ncbi:MAG: hypothetical protein L7F78_27215, partial [Syntrophales bacterium LBB04]|nr:hypothetical protein [Syntrophales bacterium LBB04]